MGGEAADVCFLTTGFPRFRGDVFGTFVLELARALVRDGLRVEVVAPHAPGVPRRETVDGVLVRRFRYALWPRLAYGDGMPTNLARHRGVFLQVPAFLLAFWWQVLRGSRRCRVLHCHWTVSALVGIWGARWWRTPVVLTVRGSDVHLAGAVVSGCNRRIWAGVDRIIAVSREIAGVLVEGGVETGKIRVIPNGVSEAFRPGDRGACRRRLGLPADAVIALFVGLLVPVKGLDVLLEALPRVRVPLTCVLVGEGELGQSLRADAETRGLRERVRFAGPQPHESVPTWMAAADLLVLPSRSEGRPNVVLEAQACGLPVVATRVGGTPELVAHGEDGLLVEAGDAEGLAAALEALAGNAERRAVFGARARARVEAEGHTWAASAGRVRQVYAEVAKGF